MNQRMFKAACGDVEKYWGDKMPMMVMEEAGELIQAISKFERKNGDADSNEYKNLIDEIGDMYISLKALELHYWRLNGKKTIETLVEERIEKKLSKKYEEVDPEIIGYDDDEKEWERNCYDDCYI